MGNIADQFAHTYRDYSTAGVASSGEHQPEKAEIRAIGQEIENQIGAAVSGITGYLDTAAREAVTPDQGTIAYVYANANDPANANNGFFQYRGAAWEEATWLYNALAAGMGATIDSVNTNYFLGDAGNATATGQNNIAFGPNSAQYLSTGGRNTLIGDRSGRDIFAGNDNFIGGYLAAFAAVGITNSVAIGSGVLAFGSAGLTDIIAIGKGAMATAAFSESIGIGSSVLNQATSGPHTATGTGAGAATIGGQRQTLYGFSAQGGAENNDVIVIGHGAVATASNQIVLGTGTQEELVMFGQTIMWHDFEALSTADGTPSENYYILRGKPATVPDAGQRNLAICRDAGSSWKSAMNNMAIGIGALELQSGTDGSAVEGKGNNTIAIGVQSAQLGKALADAVYVGVLAGQTHEYDVGATVVGFRASQKGKGSANVTALGDSALWVNIGSGNVGAGYVVAEYNRVADESIFIGRAASQYRDGTSYSVVIGHGAAGLFSEAGLTNAITGLGAFVGGDYINAIGHSSLIEYKGSKAVALGTNSARSLIGSAIHEAKSVYLGNDAGYHANQKVDALNVVVIGDGAFATQDNEVVIGNASNDNFTFGSITFSTAELSALKALAA